MPGSASGSGIRFLYSYPYTIVIHMQYTHDTAVFSGDLIKMDKSNSYHKEKNTLVKDISW